MPLDETAPRFREAVEVVLEAWTSERLTFHGKYWDFDDVEVLPKPMQQPHPPTWVAATSPEAIGWAASSGHQILMDPHASFAEIGAKYDRYVAELAANGFAAPSDTPMARLVAVAATDEEAERVAGRGRPGRWAPTATASPAAPGRATASPSGSRATSASASCGAHRRACATSSPASSEEMRLHYLMIAPLSHESFLRFTDEVLVHL